MSWRNVLGAIVTPAVGVLSWDPAPEPAPSATVPAEALVVVPVEIPAVMPSWGIWTAVVVLAFSVVSAALSAVLLLSVRSLRALANGMPLTSEQPTGDTYVDLGEIGNGHSRQPDGLRKGSSVESIWLG